MSDEIIARRESKPPHPDGSYLGVCVDIINLGEVLDTYPGKAPALVPKCALVFQTTAEDPETREPLTVHIELTVSFGKKAKLRKLLESWRGKPYTDDQVRDGVPLHKLEKQNGLLNIVHRISAAGNTYALIDTIMPPVAGMARIEPHKYTRAEFWTKRKADYAAEAAKHRGQEPAGVGAGADPGAPPHEDEDLPF